MTSFRAIGLRTFAALSVIAAVGSSMLLPTTATAQANCDWYAKTALKQQQDNERLKCGFKGPEWTTDLRAHTTWCAGVAPDAWKAQAQKRDQQLAACQKAAPPATPK
ncbi:MAG: hypothetical protein ACKVP7_29035 [Hyphomicrobiaceae bacterium]